MKKLFVLFIVATAYIFAATPAFAEMTKSMDHGSWDDIANNMTKYPQNHVVFKLSGSGIAHAIGGFRRASNPLDATLSWDVNGGMNIVVTSVSVKGYSTTSGSLSVDNQSVKSSVSSSKTVTKSGLNLGNNGSIAIKTSNGTTYITNITVTYTLTPTDAAFSVANGTVGASSTSVKETIDLDDLVTANDPHYGFNFVCTSANKSFCTIDGDHNFSATTPGEYTIDTYIPAVPDCHDASAMKTMTVTVDKYADAVSFVDAYSNFLLDEQASLASWATCVSNTAITYESSNPEVLKVENGKLIALSKGVVTLTATSAGNEMYNSAYAQMTIRVRRAEDPCGTLLLDKPATLSLNVYDTGNDNKTVYTITSEAPNDKLSFNVWEYTAATQDVWMTLHYEDNTTEKLNYDAGATALHKGDISTTPMSVEKTLTKKLVKITFGATGTLFKYFNDIKVTQKTYLNVSQSAISMPTVRAGEETSASIDIDYSDISKLVLDADFAGFRYEVWQGSNLLTDFENDCGDYGEYTLRIFYTPSLEGSYAKTFTLSASGQSQSVTFAGTADAPLPLDLVILDDEQFAINTPTVLNSLTVEEGGVVTLNAPLTVTDFFIESISSTADGSSASGQVIHPANLTVLGDAYIDITFLQSGLMSTTEWYAFTVPFPVDLQSDVFRLAADGTATKAVLGVDFVVASYNSLQRYNTGNGWQYYRNVLTPGEFYYFSVDNVHDTVFRFRKAKDANVLSGNTVALHLYGDNPASPDANWNPVGNPTLSYASASVDDAPVYVQTYINGQSCFKTLSSDDVNFVVGCPFFIQATEENSLVMNAETSVLGPLYVSSATHRAGAVARVDIAPEGAYSTDNIYISASEEAEDSYVPGRDLAKMGVGTRVPQIWVDAYGQKLSVHEALISDNQATFPLSIYAPSADTYVLSLGRDIEDTDVYLTQDGSIFWNLSLSDCALDLSKGTTDVYGIRLIRRLPSVTTHVSETGSVGQLNKLMIDGRLYILRDGVMYDVQGRIVK